MSSSKGLNSVVSISADSTTGHGTSFCLNTSATESFCTPRKTKTPLISRQLTTNKAFKRGSSFCSLSRLNLQNEDPIDFASVDNEQSI